MSMSQYKMELFGHVVYNHELSYDDLLAREEETKLLMQETLENAGGGFINFEALGDTLRFQCMLPDEDEGAFHRICEALAPNIKKGLDARMLLVDKDLDTLYYYSLVDGRWQEAIVGLPPAGYVVDAQPVTVGRAGVNIAEPERKE